MPATAAMVSELSTSTSSSARPSLAVSAVDPAGPTVQVATSPTVLLGGSSSSSISANASGPTDTLLSLPPPLLRLLVVSAPFVRALTTLSQLLTWTHPNRYAPFLLLVAWTALCLGGERIARYGLNGVLLAVLGVGWVAKRGGKVYSAKNQNRPTAGSEQVRTLASATSTQGAVQVLTPTALEALLHRASILAKHLQVLQATLRPLGAPFDWRDPSLSLATVNLLITGYPFYLLLTYFVPVRHIVLLAGLIILTWEAPWLAVVRKALWSSLLVRRTARFGLRILQGDLRLAQAEVKEGPKNVGFLARLRGARTLSFDLHPTMGKARSGSPSRVPGGKGDVAVSALGAKEQQMSHVQLQSQQPEGMEIQYMFTIFENQRWWIGLEWTQALLPNERPSWSDPTHAPSVPPGAFTLPSPSTSSHAGVVRTYTWKWLDPEWRIRGTAGVMISPSTIGANANPPSASGSGQPAAGKDIKDTLGDWRAKLRSQTSAAVGGADGEKERRGSSGSAVSDSPASAANGANHARQGSSSNSGINSIFGEGLNALMGAKDGRPIAKASGSGEPASPSKGRSNSEASAQMDAADKEEEVPGHPTRLEESELELDVADWTVDREGWVYADNHWEKPSSKGGMGRYTRRRAWVRRAIVVEKVELLPPSTATAAQSKKQQ